MAVFSLNAQRGVARRLRSEARPPRGLDDDGTFLPAGCCCGDVDVANGLDDDDGSISPSALLE